jgi:Transglutaminase-like superfamily
VEPTPSGTNQWQWVVADIPEIRHERRMPPWPGVAGRMVVAFLAPGARPQNGFLTWDDMARWQTGLANGKRDATPEINSKVAEITAGKPMPQQQLQQIAQYIQKDIRYVAIEIGIGGWQPHSATEIFSHRYGDCKDKATLMSTMLKLAGIDSYYLFINTRRGAVGPETPPERMFDHAILAIKLPAEIKDPRYQAIFNHPKLGNLLIFDPTNEKTPIGQLSGELQGNYALLVSPEGGELIRTPQLPTMSNGITRTGNFSLDAQGTLKAEIAESRKGDLASWERHEQSSVSNSKDRVKRIEQEVSHSIGMFEMTSASMTGLDANEVPFGYSYTFVAPGYAKQAGELLVVRPRVMGIETSDLLETKEARKFPVIFEGPRKDTDAFEITLPGGYEVDDLPPPTDIDYSFASYHSKTDAAGNKLKYTRTLEIKELSVPMEKMDELKKFYRVIASDERNTAVLKPSTAAASAK